MPRTITRMPPPISNQRMFWARNVPKNVTEAPRAIKTIEKPRMNIRELMMTFFRTYLKFLSEESSSMDMPVIKAM
ncbi:hypothetical protein ES703_27954 [subsurface metagenome]